MADAQRLHPDPVLSPAGQGSRDQTDLARRPAPLAGRRVVLFDNGKLDPAYGPFLAIFDAVAAALREREPGVALERVTVDLLATADDPVAQARRYIAAHDPAAVVLALADSGVTQRTVELARQLEEVGVPTVTLACEPGTGLAAAIAGAQIPGLPLVDLPVLRTQSRTDVHQIAAQHADDLLAGLLQPVAEQWERFRVRYPDAAAPTEDAALTLSSLTVKGRQTVDPGKWAEEAYERLLESGLGDGLPVIPPTAERVAAMIAAGGRPAEDVLSPALVPSGAAVTIEKLAVNAILAGCRPEYFPLLLVAVEAMAEPRYRLAQAAITSHPSGNLLLVSGPVADALGISGGAGCLGPGHRANATIGRALTLTLMNVGRIRPGAADLAAFGSPVEFSYCFAENRAASPWPGLAEERYGAGASAIFVHRCEAPHNVIDHLSTTPEGLLTGVAAVAATIGGNNAYIPAELVVLLNPEHAALIAGAGWTKRDVQLFLWDEARVPADQVSGRGLPPQRRPANVRGDWIPVVDEPSDIIIVVAGGPGPQSMVAIPWGFAKGVWRPLPAASP